MIYRNLPRRRSMSSMLEQAVIDAEALREVAIKKCGSRSELRSIQKRLKAPSSSF